MYFSVLFLFFHGLLRIVTSSSYKLCFHPEEPGKHGKLQGLYYSFYQSRRSPLNDPVILWLSGGPGCSSMIAMFMENGPCSVNEEDGSVIVNDYSWNAVANVIWVDQPLGTGFSDEMANKDKKWKERSAIERLLAFLEEFYDKNYELHNNKLFIFGESYAGHYVPDLAYLIKTQGSSVLLKSLNGIGIGNGYTDPASDALTLPHYLAENNYFRGIIDRDEKENLIRKAQECSALIDKCEEINSDSTEENDNCGSMEFVCSQYTSSVHNVLYTHNLNPYDLRKTCIEDPHNLCYRFAPLTQYINSAYPRMILQTNKTWVPCNADVWLKHRAVDWYRETQLKVGKLLNLGIRVLIYAGDADSMCNWMGQQKWTNELEWNWKECFVKAQERSWTVNHAVVGTIQSCNALTFVKVFQSGHMVPHDQPAVALSMVDAFIHDQPLSR